MTTVRRSRRRALAPALALAAVLAGPVATAAPAFGAPASAVVVRGADSPGEDSRDAQREGSPQPGGEDSPEVGEDEGLKIENATAETWLSVLAVAVCSAIIMGAGALRRPKPRSA